MNTLLGKVAIVTGGASGIGEACCWALAKAGAKVMIADKQDDKSQHLQQALQEQGYIACWKHCDVTESSQWEKLIESTQSQLGGFDILVNNAGVAIVGSIEELSLADWNSTIAINQTSVFWELNMRSSQ